MSSIYVFFAIYISLTYADITTEPPENYYEYVTFPSEANATNEENVTLSAVFELRNYSNVCNGGETNQTRDLCETLQSQEEEVVCSDFLNVVQSMMEFACGLFEVDAEIAMNNSRNYLSDCKERNACEGSVQIVNSLLEGMKLCRSIDNEFLHLVEIMHNIMAIQKRIGPMNESHAWEMIVTEQKVLVDGVDRYIHNVTNVLRYLDENNLTGIFMSSYFFGRTNINSLQGILQKQRNYLQYCQHMQATWNRIDVVRFDIRLATFLILFFVGVSGNVTLLLVFVKYPDMRTRANVMLINLAVVDCVCLILNLPLTYLKTTSLWPLGAGGCQAFYFVRYVTICVSTYSVVMISVQRYLAVTKFPTAHGCSVGEKAKTIMMLSGVWLLAILYSLPRLIFSEIYMGMCSDVNDNIIGAMTTADLVVICVVPTLLMGLFSYLTAARIKKSVASPTGERTGQEQLRHNRMLSAHVLTGLAVLFIVSYFPSFLLYFIRFQMEVKLGDLEMYVVDIVTYLLQFTNSCLNPIALCIMSRKYKKYFKEIYSCCKMPGSIHKTLASSDASVSTTVSSI